MQKYSLLICILRLPLKTARGKRILKNDNIQTWNTLSFLISNLEVSQFWLDNFRSSLTFLSTHSIPFECYLLHVIPAKLQGTCSYLTFEHTGTHNASVNWPGDQAKLNQKGKLVFFRKKVSIKFKYSYFDWEGGTQN